LKLILAEGCRRKEAVTLDQPSRIVSLPKAGLDALTRVMAVELGPHGIRTNSVNPTVTLTPMAERAWSDPVKAGPMQARIPLGRFVKPGEVVSAILFLLSDATSMINGVCLDVDGGLRAA
jgi:L-xylulose reductase